MAGLCNTGHRRRRTDNPKAESPSATQPLGWVDDDYKDVLKKHGAITIYEVKQESHFGIEYRQVPLYAQPPAPDAELQAWRDHGKRFGFSAGVVGHTGKWQVFEDEAADGTGVV